MATGKEPSAKRSTPESRGGDYYRSLPDAELDALWKKRVALKITESDEVILRGILRERKGFKPVERHISMCMRCNLPADNCACLNR